MRFITTLLALSFLGATAAQAEMNLTSSDLAAGKPMADAQVFNGFGCSGKNISPQLKWSGAPSGTKSFAIMAYDPDAPTGSGWWHWTVFNLPTDATEIATGASGKLPAGAIEGRTTSGRPATVAHARRKATDRTATSSRSTRCLSTSSPSTRTPRPPWLVSLPGPTRWTRRRSRSHTNADLQRRASF
ncbi:phosphatidylethanolamine-binding protein (PEBP) family uncharacterized protein [Sinorhizobium fredii]